MVLEIPQTKSGDLSLLSLNGQNKNKDEVKLKGIKTGTTIAGIIFRDGVILGADTRATEGPMVAEGNCEKIHYLAKNIYCCGAGTAADTEHVTRQIASDLELYRLEADEDLVPIDMAVTLLKRHLFNYQGHIGAALIIGGFDKGGAKLATVAPHGNVMYTPYVTMGSGSLAAMTVYESRYKPDMTEEEGKKLVRDAIAAGIFNDLGSGSNIDLCVLTKAGTKYLRNYEKPNPRQQRQVSYKFPIGTTQVKKVEKIPVDFVSRTLRTEREEPMEV